MKRSYLLTIPLVLVLCFALLSFPNDYATLHIAWAAISHGDIFCFEVWQYNTTHWNLVENFTSTGGSTRITDGLETAFFVGIQFNLTYADDNAEARSFTRVYMNITNGGTVWDNEELNATGSVTSDAEFYYMKELGNWTSSLPTAGVTYTCNMTYQGYY